MRAASTKADCTCSSRVDIGRLYVIHSASYQTMGNTLMRFASCETEEPAPGPERCGQLMLSTKLQIEEDHAGVFRNAATAYKRSGVMSHGLSETGAPGKATISVRPLSAETAHNSPMTPEGVVQHSLLTSIPILGLSQNCAYCESWKRLDEVDGNRTDSPASVNVICHVHMDQGARSAARRMPLTVAPRGLIKNDTGFQLRYHNLNSKRCHCTSEMV